MKMVLLKESSQGDMARCWCVISLLFVWGTIYGHQDSLHDKNTIDSLKGVIENLEARGAYKHAIEKLEVSERGLQNQRDNFSDFYTAFGVLAALVSFFLAIIGIALSVLGVNLKEDIKKIRDDASSDIKQEKEKLRVQVTDEIARIAEQEKSLVKSILDFRLQKDKLRKESKIIVVNNKATTDLESFNRALSGFNKTTKSVDTLDEIDVSELINYDLVIIENNGIGKWETEPAEKPSKRETKIAREQREAEDKNRAITHARLTEILNEVLITTPVVVYTKRFSDKHIKPDRLHKLSFANMPSQLYGNVMNLLKFMEISKSDNA